MSFISATFELLMGGNGIHALIKDAQKHAEKHNFPEALQKVNKALGFPISEDEKKHLMALRENILQAENDYRSEESKRRILKALDKKDLNFAKDLYEKAHRNELSEDDDAEVYKEMTYREYLVQAEHLQHEGELDQAVDYVKKAIALYTPPREEAQIRFDSICKDKKVQIAEDKRMGHQPIELFGSFNVPKKENEGEDADPLSFVDNNLNWGSIGVFDGMGGAGAKKYKNIKTDEEHTSAYWGSRIVRDCVEDLLIMRPKGTNPFEWIDTMLHSSIVDKLNEKIKDFPNANGAVLSKMTRKLPTTMAMSTYEINDNNVDISTYWSGDSRVYLLKKDTLEILTIDDVNAEDGDPFSPINMDLAMNNAISQEREFRINKSFVQMSLSSESPFLLIAATDGCFGYYKNPIEFEAMLRNCLTKAENAKEYLGKIQEAIIDNIQQDDFSISIVGFGSDNFEDYKKILSSDKDIELITGYFDWRKSADEQQTEVKKQISGLETELNTLRDKLERLHSIQEKENMDWYAKYKETFSVVKRDDIKPV